MTYSHNSSKGKQGFQVKHGLKNVPEYQIWNGMKNRCLNPKVAAYARYGARGIYVCERWLDDFAAFYADMGPRPSPEHSLDRIDGAGPYAPENCRWATLEEQLLNRRSAYILTHDGRTQPLMLWAKELGFDALDLNAIRARLRQGWDHSRALTEPIARKHWQARRSASLARSSKNGSSPPNARRG